MNNVFFKRASLLLSLTSVTVLASGLSVQAQTINSNVERKDNKVLTSASVLRSEPIDTRVAQVDPTAPDNTTPTTPGTGGSVTPTTPGTDGTVTPTTPGTDSTVTPTTPGTQTVPPTTTPGTDGTVTPTTPGTDGTVTPTTPGTQMPPTTTPETTPTTPSQETAPSQESTPTQPSFGSDVRPGRATRSGSSYVGVAGNIGLGGGGTALGLGNFTIISKIGLTNSISVRPSAIIGDNTTVLIPITYDFNLRSTGIDEEALSSFAPYLGAGIGIATGDNSDVAPMVTAGVDVPLTRQFTATAAVNAGFFDSTSVGLAIGVGYNFNGF